MHLKHGSGQEMGLHNLLLIFTEGISTCWRQTGLTSLALFSS
jgi:hypothetical protein